MSVSSDYSFRETIIQFLREASISAALISLPLVPTLRLKNGKKKKNKLPRTRQPFSSNEFIAFCNNSLITQGPHSNYPPVPLGFLVARRQKRVCRGAIISSVPGHTYSLMFDSSEKRGRDGLARNGGGWGGNTEKKSSGKVEDFLPRLAFGCEGPTRHTWTEREMVARELLHERILTQDRDRRTEKEKVCPSDQHRLLRIHCWSFI